MARLERAIDQAIEGLPEKMRAVIDGLQALRGIKEIAWKAQHRLCTRYRRLLAKGKLRQKVTVAIGRELLGFIWVIGVQVENEQRLQTAKARAA